jgi:hypothetical protein
MIHTASQSGAKLEKRLAKATTALTNAQQVGRHFDALFILISHCISNAQQYLTHQSMTFVSIIVSRLIDTSVLVACPKRT